MSEHVKAAFEHRVSSRLPRGELWIGTEIFLERQMEDSIDSHISLCHEMEMDLISIPVCWSESGDLGYRTFNPLEIQKATESDLFVIAVVSGPFQRLVDKKGLRQVLADVAGDVVEAQQAVVQEAKHLQSLIETCTYRRASAVVIAEDIAYDQGGFFTNAVFQELLYPIYRYLVDDIHHCGAFAVFHSCGNITSVFSDIVSSGFDGLSCQVECLDLLSLKRAYGNQLTLFTGLNRDLLDTINMSPKQKQQYIGNVIYLGEGGGFVLSSSSGLHSSNMVDNLQMLYHLADAAWNRAK